MSAPRAIRRAAAAVLTFTLVVAAAGAAGADESGAGTGRPEAAVTPIDVRSLTDISPVKGADGKVHLAYELQLANLFPKVVTIEAVEVLDPTDDDAVISELTPEVLSSTLRLDDTNATGTTLAPGVGGVLFVDVALAPSAGVPTRVEHRFRYTISDPGAAPGAPVEFVGVPVKVLPDDPVIVAAPLAGGGWVVGNGCCDAITAHRGATLPIDGTIHVPERFAIDFVQLDDDGKLFDGPLDDNESYGYFGDQVYAAADGTVVEVQDGLPDQTPGSLDPNATVQTAGGNYVVVDIGDGRYAFYAHFQPDTIRVKKGDDVEAGDVLGLLGNSGNTDGAHLHFHVMDGPSPLLSNGLPFEFRSFTGEGRLTTPIEELQAGAAAELDATNRGDHRNELPLNLEVIGFPKVKRP